MTHARSAVGGESPSSVMVVDLELEAQTCGLVVSERK